MSAIIPNYEDLIQTVFVGQIYKKGKLFVKLSQIQNYMDSQAVDQNLNLKAVKCSFDTETP